MTEQHKLILQPLHAASRVRLASAVDQHYDPHTQFPGEYLVDALERLVPR